MNNFNVRKLMLALMAMLVVFGMGVFKKQINGDRTFHKFVLEQGGKYTYTIDVGKMGNVKYLLEPNIMTLYLRCKVPDDVKDLRCEIEGIENFASQGSKKGVWKKIDRNVVLKRGQWGDFIPLNLELAVPRNNIDRYVVGKGIINFYNTDKHFATLDLKIINSKVK